MPYKTALKTDQFRRPVGAEDYKDLMQTANLI